MAWTEQRVELLKTLWSEGRSCSGIASELGDNISRNAVIGKVHRLGLPARGGSEGDSVQKRITRVRTAVRRKRAVKPLTPIEEAFADGPEATELPEDTPTKPVTLLEAREADCRWPIGDPRAADFVFCGGDKVKGTPYCARHCRMAYAPKGNTLNITDEERARRRAHAQRLNRAREEARA